MHLVLLGHHLFDDLGEGVVAGVRREGMVFVYGNRLRVKPDAHHRVAAEEQHLFDVLTAAGFEDVESAADADIEERVRVLLGRGQLHHRSAAPHHLGDRFGIGNAAVDGGDPVARQWRLMHQGADVQATPMQHVQYAATELTATAKNSDCLDVHAGEFTHRRQRRQEHWRRRRVSFMGLDQPIGLGHLRNAGGVAG